MRRSHVKKENRRKVIIAIISAIFLISSIATVVLYRTDDAQGSLTFTLNGKDYEFMMDQESYLVNVDKQPVRLYSLPPEVMSMSYDNSTADILRSSDVVIITFDPSEPDLSYIDFVRLDLMRTLSSMGKNVGFAVTSPSDTYDFPVMTCENASVAPILRIMSSNTTYVREEGGCITIASRSMGLLRARDRIVYDLYGMI